MRKFRKFIKEDSNDVPMDRKSQIDQLNIINKYFKDLSDTIESFSATGASAKAKAMLSDIKKMDNQLDSQLFQFSIKQIKTVGEFNKAKEEAMTGVRKLTRMVMDYVDQARADVAERMSKLPK